MDRKEAEMIIKCSPMEGSISTLGDAHQRTLSKGFLAGSDYELARARGLVEWVKKEARQYPDGNEIHEILKSYEEGLK